MVDFAAAVLEQHDSELNSIDLIHLNDGKELTPADERLVQALAETGGTQCTSLHLEGNRSWWEEPTLMALQLDFIKS